MRASGDQLRQISALVDDGVLRPTVGRVFSFEQTPEALQSLAAGGIRGKAVVALTH
jgi:NADPH:quinone reductase-like Zn-dependent oxidoreductase